MVPQMGLPLDTLFHVNNAILKAILGYEASKAISNECSIG
jgi:hypothetical protein